MARQIKKILDRCLELLVMGVVGVLVVAVLWQVFSRYVLQSPSKWTEELATFLLIWVALLGAAVATGRGAHLGIDYFVQKLPPRDRMGAEIFAFLCIALFAFFVMILGGAELVRMTLDLKQKSPALGIQMGYVYLAVPISGFFMLLYSVIGLSERAVRFFRGPDFADDSQAGEFSQPVQNKER
jgi:TRAP-type C4-dicarboxylate transport system permease small subunit